MYFLLWLYFCIFVPWHTHLRVYAKLLSRCFIFLFSIKNKQVHSLNMESSIIANIFTQISFLFFGGYGKTETWDPILRPGTQWDPRRKTLHKIPEIRDPGPNFFFIFPKFSSENFENANSSVFKPLLDKITL